MAQVAGRHVWPDSEAELIRASFARQDRRKALARCCKLLPHRSKNQIREWVGRHLGVAFNRRSQLTHASPSSEHCRPGTVAAVRTYQGWRCGQCRGALYRDWDGLPRCLNCGTEARRP